MIINLPPHTKIYTIRGVAPIHAPEPDAPPLTAAGVLEKHEAVHGHAGRHADSAFDLVARFGFISVAGLRGSGDAHEVAASVF